MVPSRESTATPASQGAIEARVLEVVAALAEELGGSRARRAVAAGASLERDIGLGSLERVELLLRLESALGGRFGDEMLQLDTPAALAHAIARGETQDGAEPGERRRLVMPAPALAAAVADDVHTLSEALWVRAAAEPDRPHVYLREDDGSESTITYRRLQRGAAEIAAGLAARGVRAGDTIGLMLPTGFDFLRCFQGILLARAVPVPIYPPLRLDRLEEYARRQSAILADAGVTLLVTIPKAMGIGALLQAGIPSLREVVSPDDLAEPGASWGRPECVGSDLAFIQYTSGSTGSPKGVALTHENLLANIRGIAAGIELLPTDVGASWLPLYHDMGLIGSWLFCMTHGVPIAIQSPLAFLARPERWLWTIHQRRATLSAAPNFAYELCVRKIPDAALEGLDLSSWRCAFNGAEPVNPETLDRFARRFAKYGFRREALTPVYGLAENSVALAVPPMGRGPKVDLVARAPFASERRAVPAADDDKHALKFVAVGRALPLHEIRIVDEAGQDVAERLVGRLIFRGPSMMAGYHNQPAATAAVTVHGDWIDSGDLAYSAAGEIYVTGRIKDLIIKGGRNLVPQEIEEVASTVDGVRKGCVAAFGVAHKELGTETLVVAAETRATEAAARDALVAAVNEKVADAVGVPPDRVVLVPPGSIPKTSSGKIQRNATRELYESGRLGHRERTSWMTRLRIVAGALLGALRPRLAAAGHFAYTLYVGGLALIVLAVVWPLSIVLPPRALRPLLRHSARALMRVAFGDVRVEGLLNLPRTGPMLLAANHTSYLDIVALVAYLPFDFAFVAKREVARWPFIGRLLRKGGHLTVERLDSQQSVADAARVRETIDAGRPVLFFPEGTFAPFAGLRPFRLGAFKTSVETGVPIVPVALRGLRGALRARQWMFRPGALRVLVAPPIAPEGDDWRAVVTLRDRVADAIALRCGEPRIDLVASGLAGLPEE
jgi:1-acyl-sn-glycerol-3-phosphate acyltransferase